MCKFHADTTVVGRVTFGPLVNPLHRGTQSFVTEPYDPWKVQPKLWPLIQALERACWKRKWSEVKAARKALEAEIGDRPHDPLFKSECSDI